MSSSPPNSSPQPRPKKLTKTKLKRGDSDNSTTTMTSANIDDPTTDKVSIEKTVSFAPSPAGTPPVSPGEKSPADTEFVRHKTDKPKKPTFKRNLSSLWRALDPPSDAQNSGVLHNLATKEIENHRRRKSADSVTLLETTADKTYKQR